MGLDARNLSVLLIENYLKAKKGEQEIRIVAHMDLKSGMGRRHESLSDLIFIRFACNVFFFYLNACMRISYIYNVCVESIRRHAYYVHIAFVYFDKYFV